MHLGGDIEEGGVGARSSKSLGIEGEGVSYQRGDLLVTAARYLEPEIARRCLDGPVAVTGGRGGTTRPVQSGPQHGRTRRQGDIAGGRIGWGTATDGVGVDVDDGEVLVAAGATGLRCSAAAAGAGRQGIACLDNVAVVAGAEALGELRHGNGRHQHAEHQQPGEAATQPNTAGKWLRRLQERYRRHDRPRMKQKV